MSKGIIKLTLNHANLEDSKTLTGQNVTVDFRIGAQKSLITFKEKNFKSTQTAFFNVQEDSVLEIYAYPSFELNEDLVVYGEVKLNALFEHAHTRNHITVHLAYKQKGVLNEQKSGLVEVEIVYVEKLDGVLEINVQSAELYRDTEFAGKMDPFVELKIDDVSKKTTVKQEAGKSPVWNESFFFIISSLDSKLSLVVQDEDVTTNDIVGTTDVELRQEILKVSTDWIERTAELNYKGKVAGRLSYSTRFAVNLAKKP